MKCLLAQVLDDQVVLMTREGEFRTVSLDFLRSHLPPAESDLSVELLRAWRGRELELPWPPPQAAVEEQAAAAEGTPAGRPRGRWADGLRRIGFGSMGLPRVAGALVAAAVVAFTLLPRVLLPRPAAVVAIDINPSLELQVDGAGRVVQGTPLNADAQRLLASLTVRGLTLDQAVDRVIDQAVAFGYLAPGKDNVVLASVVPIREGWAPDPAGLQREVSGRLRAAGLSGYVSARQVAKEVREQGRQDRLSVNREVARQALSQKGIPYPVEALRGQSIQQALKEAGLDVTEAFPGGERPERDAGGSDETRQQDRDVNSGANGSESPDARAVEGAGEFRTGSSQEKSSEPAREEKSAGDSKVEASEPKEAQDQSKPAESPEGKTDSGPASESKEAPEAPEDAGD